MSDYSIFPKAIDGYAQLPLSVDRVTPVSAEGMNRLRSAIINIENALGALPQAEFEDVAERLDAIDGDITSLEALVATLNGDVIGPSSATNNSLAQFDGATGKLIKEFGIGADGLALVADSTAPSGLSWSSASENLANTLLLGNETLGSNVIFSTGDDLVGETDLTIRTDADLADLTLKTADGVDSGSVIIQTGTGSSTRGTVEVKSPEVLFDNGTQSAAFLVGTGDPNGSVTAITGSIFVDSTGPGIYQNDSGGTAWTDVFGWPTATGLDYAGTPYEQALVTATNGYIVITPNGTGSIQAQVADGTSAGGNSRGDYAVDLQINRANAPEVASGDYSIISGGRNNTASGYTATVSGGSNNANSGVHGTIGGGSNNTASGGTSTVVGGTSNTASGFLSAVGGCRDNTASDSYSTISGGRYSLADHYAEFAHASGEFAATGDAQYSRMVLRRQTTNSTPSELSADGAAPTGTDRLSLANETAYKFQIDLVAKEANAANAAWWQISGCILRDATAASTILVGTPTVTTDNTGTGTAATWSVAVTADTTNGALAITVTGAAATIRWVAVVHSSKVGAP